eukprot:659313-Amorphochlora_amoeboformis.AAC.1
MSILHYRDPRRNWWMKALPLIINWPRDYVGSYMASLCSDMISLDSEASLGSDMISLDSDMASLDSNMASLGSEVDPSLGSAV